jgi:hypothetical protein
MPTARGGSIHRSPSLVRSPESSYLDRVVKEASMTTKRLIAFGVLIALVGGLCVAGWADPTFADAALGYSIDYPAGWLMTQPDDYSVRFGGPDGVYVKIQNVASAAIGGNYTDVESLAANLRCQLVSGAESICIYGGGPFDVTDADGVQLAGIQFLAEYTYNGVTVKEWYAVVEHASGDILYVLSYTASSDAYAAHEPAVVAMVRTWTVGGASTSGPATFDSTSPPGVADIAVILQDSGHIGPYHYAESAYDKRLYEFTVSAAGYVALCVVDEAREAITGWIFAADGTQVTVKPGNYADVYTTSYPVGPGTYTVKVGQDNMVTESDFEMYVYFSLAPFTIDDLVAQFGPRVRVLP